MELKSDFPIRVDSIWDPRLCGQLFFVCFDMVPLELKSRLFLAVVLICLVFSFVVVLLCLVLSFVLFLKKNQFVPRPSEHPPVRGKKCQNV